MKSSPPKSIVQIDYSGFQTKQQELIYNQLLEKIMQYLSFKLISVFKQAVRCNFNLITGQQLTTTLNKNNSQVSVDESNRSNTQSSFQNQNIQTFLSQHYQWLDLVKNLFKTLHKMEKQKKSEPKFSKALFPLMKYLKHKHNFQTGNVNGQETIDTETSVYSNHETNQINSPSFMSSIITTNCKERNDTKQQYTSQNED